MLSLVQDEVIPEAVKMEWSRRHVGDLQSVVRYSSRTCSQNMPRGVDLAAPTYVLPKQSLRRANP